MYADLHRNPDLAPLPPPPAGHRPGLHPPRPPADRPSLRTSQRRSRRISRPRPHGSNPRLDQQTRTVTPRAEHAPASPTLPHAPTSPLNLRKLRTKIPRFFVRFSPPRIKHGGVIKVSSRSLTIASPVLCELGVFAFQFVRRRKSPAAQTNPIGGAGPSPPSGTAGKHHYPKRPKTNRISPAKTST